MELSQSSKTTIETMCPVRDEVAQATFPLEIDVIASGTTCEGQVSSAASFANAFILTLKKAWTGRYASKATCFGLRDGSLLTAAHCFSIPAELRLSLEPYRTEDGKYSFRCTKTSKFSNLRVESVTPYLLKVLIFQLSENTA